MPIACCVGKNVSICTDSQTAISALSNNLIFWCLGITMLRVIKKQMLSLGRMLLPTAISTTRMKCVIWIRAKTEHLSMWKKTEGCLQTKYFGFLPMTSFTKRLKNVCMEDLRLLIVVLKAHSQLLNL